MPKHSGSSARQSSSYAFAACSYRYVRRKGEDHEEDLAGVRNGRIKWLHGEEHSAGCESSRYGMGREGTLDSVVEDYIEEIDLLLVGPHLAYMLGDLEEIAEPYDVPVAIIPKDAYGNLDGDAVCDLIQEDLAE